MRQQFKKKKKGHFTRCCVFSAWIHVGLRYIFGRLETASRTKESLNPRARHYHTGIAAISERRGVGPGIFVKIVLSSLRLQRRSALLLCGGGRTAASIVRPFIIPVWFSPLLHLSIRPFISPSISSYRLLLHMWIHLSQAGLRLQVHIQTSQSSVSASFSNIGWNTQSRRAGVRMETSPGAERGFFFFFTLILPIRPTYTELKAISLPLAELFSAVSGGIGGRSHPADCFRYYLPSTAARTAVMQGSRSIPAIPPSFRLTSNRLK